LKEFPTIALLLFVYLFAARRSSTAETPEVHVEIGTLDGASYRIDMPAKWNGVLLVYYHGYSEHPVVFEKDLPNDFG